MSAPSSATTLPLLTPGDPEWDVARQAWNLAVDQRPAAVAVARSDEDVVAAVGLAAERGLRVAPQGTGHGAAPLGPLDDTLLLKTSGLAGAEVDPAARRARVRAGALWGDLTAAAARHGLAGLAGSAADVGVVGYCLGGGVGWLARRYGLASNSVLAIELVTAGGQRVRCDREHEPELFWALRGGGGGYGVVTALELALVGIAEVHAGLLAWPMERAAEVLHAWRAWTGGVSADVTSLGRLLRVPPLPEIPEPLRGRALVVVEAACLLGEDDAREALAPLRALEPELDTFATVPAPALQHLHMDPDQPVPGVGEGLLLRELPTEAIDALVAAAGAGTQSPLLSVEVRHLGGAVARSAPEHGALDAIAAPFALYGVGIAPDAEAAAAVDGHLDAVRGVLAPWADERAYLPFAERRTTPERLFGAAAAKRLRAVKLRFDPDDRVRANHPV